MAQCATGCGLVPQIKGLRGGVDRRWLAVAAPKANNNVGQRKRHKPYLEQIHVLHSARGGASTGRLHLKVEINIKRTTGSKKVGDASFPVKELLGQKNSTDQMRKTSMTLNEVIKDPSPNLHRLSLRRATRLTLHLGSSILHNNFPLSRLVHSPTIRVVTLTLPTHIRHPAPALRGLMQVIPIMLHLADSILPNSFTLSRLVTLPTTRAFTLPTHIHHPAPAFRGLMQVVPIMLHLADSILPNSFTLSRVVTLPTTRAFTLPTTRVFTLTLPIQRTCHPSSALHRLVVYPQNPAPSGQYPPQQPYPQQGGYPPA